MTIKDLQRLISESEKSQGEKLQSAKLFATLNNKPFWYWNRDEHRKDNIESQGECCFNHIVGLPVKNSIRRPMYDYEKLLDDTLQQHKYIWIKKATGLGITEFMLRYMAYLCLKDDTYRGSQMVIVTGPNVSLAIGLIDRMKKLFEPHSINFQTKETVIELNGVRIEAYPSHHLDAFRSLERPSFILLDEADFFSIGQQADARHVSERYIAKSDPYIIMVSTPNAPGGLFENIEKEPEDTCIYKRLKLDYMLGLHKIFSPAEIEKARQSPSFEREYNLAYLGKIGNVFHTKDIERATKSQYDLEPNPMSSISMGIDPGFGSSPFGICICQLSDATEENDGLVDSCIQVLFAEEYDRQDYNEMLAVCDELIQKYDPIKIWVDGSNSAFVHSLKLQLGEDANYLEAIKRYEHQKINYRNFMRVIPVSFLKEHKAMLGHTKMLLEQGHIAINSKFDKLLISLHTAVEQDGKLDKSTTSHDDVFDGFRLSINPEMFPLDIT